MLDVEEFQPVWCLIQVGVGAWGGVEVGLFTTGRNIDGWRGQGYLHHWHENQMRRGAQINSEMITLQV